MKVREPSPSQLRALVALAEYQHFGAAAAALGVSQPAVSTAITGLEKTLGARLVERSTRSVRLTPAGAEAARLARPVLAALHDLADAVAHLDRPHTGPIRIGIIPTIAPYLLPSLLAGLGKAFPSLAPHVVEDQTARLLDELDRGRIDVALTALPSGGENVCELPLYAEDFVLTVPAGHPLANVDRLRPSALRGLPLLLLEEGHCLRDQALDICRHAGASTDHPASAASLATIVQLVAAGLGTTLLPHTALAVETRRAKVATVRFAEPAPGRTVGLLHRASSARADEYAAVGAVIRTSVRRAGLPVHS